MSDALPSAEPFFLIGAERSGTTLMSLMLDHHPRIHCPFESNYLVDYLTADGGDPDPVVLQQRLAMDRIARADGFKVLPGQGYKEAARAFLARCAETSGKPIFGVAIHRHSLDILQLWPQARFLNLVRDPRDVASSVIAMGWAGTFWHGSRAWVHAQEEAQELFERIPAGSRCALKTWSASPSPP